MQVFRVLNLIFRANNFKWNVQYVLYMKCIPVIITIADMVLIADMITARTYFEYDWAIGVIHHPYALLAWYLDV